jgi:ElaB/YqjD/DUF883 family membrane-anchored ribosome-binding protein
MAIARKKNGFGEHHLDARLKSLREDLGALQSDVLGLMNEVGAAASDQVQGAMRETADRVENWGNEKLPSMGKIVRGNPFAACAVLLSAGAVLGAILSRR